VKIEVIIGDALAEIRDLPDGIARCCVTSPPYWGLRDYGVEGQIGLERMPEEYISKLVAVFRELRRVLADDGTLWLNLGDCYATGAGKVGDHPGGGEQGERWKGNRGTHDANNSGKHSASLAAMGPRTQPNRMPIRGLKPKDLVGIPWRVAFALQADSWHLRSDIIWSKPNPMPESVRDRPTKAHEYLFLLSKNKRYYYDAAAIAEPANWPEGPWGIPSQKHAAASNGKLMRTAAGLVKQAGVGRETRNKRSVWTIPTAPFPEAHFATFPPALVTPCILAGSAIGDTVIDPFAGAGTTGLVASRLNRNFVGIELNPKYAEMARRRIEQDAPLLYEQA
jgi:DNA modification methylase